MPPPGPQVAPRTLPYDIWHATLQYLSPPELRKAASASRALREAAKHAGFHIHRNIIWDSARRDVYFRGIQAFLDLVDYAEANNARISLKLTFKGFTMDSQDHKNAAYEYSGHIFEHLAKGIARALPYLVYLRLMVPDYFRKDLDNLLCRPAPHLHTLELCDFGIPGWRRAAPLIPLPLNIFTGDVPKLRNVSLESVPLPPAPPAAFARVTHLRLEFEDIFPNIDAGLYFPALDSLHIDFYLDRYLPGPKYILRGLRLSSLTVDTNDQTFLLPMIHDVLDLTSIPVVRILRKENLREGCAWSPTLASRDRSDLCATVTGSRTDAGDEEEDVDIILTLPRPGWRREFRMCEWFLEEPSALLGEGTGLVSLRIENKFVASLLEGNLALPVLRDLRIDMRPRGEYSEMLWPLMWDLGLDTDECGKPLGTVYHVPCPCLEKLSIVSAGAPMQINSNEVLQLGKALGQSDRCAGQLAQLLLRRVTFKRPVDLATVFSDIVHDLMP